MNAHTHSDASGTPRVHTDRGRGVRQDVPTYSPVLAVTDDREAALIAAHSAAMAWRDATGAHKAQARVEAACLALMAYRLGLA